MARTATAKTSPLNEIIHGDALAVFKGWPAELVDCIVTSPPYWQQRDYRGRREQVGREATPAEYVERLTAIFGECRRVMKSTGTLWLVIGDKYDDGAQLGLPWRVALALIDDGWILRADCIWHKPNAMPSSAKSRPTIDHEYVFFFTKSKDYYYDADAIREPHVTFSENSRMRGGRRHFGVRGGTPEIRQKRRQQQPARRPLGPGLSSARPQQTHRLVDSAFQIPRRPLRRLSRIARRNVHSRRLPRRRPRPRSVRRQRHRSARRPASGRDYLGIDCVAEYCQMATRRIGQASDPTQNSAAPPPLQSSSVGRRPLGAALSHPTSTSRRPSRSYVSTASSTRSFACLVASHAEYCVQKGLAAFWHQAIKVVLPVAAAFDDARYSQ